MRPNWDDASTNTYTAESTKIGDHLVCVCLDDEGPLSPAYYWCIEKDQKLVTWGWAASVYKARIAALREARSLQ